MGERLAFVRFWAKYIREHTNKEWSSQQNVLINSVLKSADQDAERYLKVKRAAAGINARQPPLS